MSPVTVHLGLDDIDSPRGGCTTHFASVLVERLMRLNVEWLDYPNLIRLNPNIPYRTRGNGAVALRFVVDPSHFHEILPLVQDSLEDYVVHGYANTNPGVVMLRGNTPMDVTRLSELALWRVLPLSVVKRLVNRLNLPHLALGNGRGLIGAIAAVGNRLTADHTYEYLAYRPLEMATEERGIDEASVLRMDAATRPHTFSNVDETNGAVLIAPHGPDPVLFGIRGETAQDVIDAASYIVAQQPIERWTVFRTNQGTAEHLRHYVRIRDLRPYMAVVVRARVAERPRMTVGGHLFAKVSDTTGSVECAFYEPTGDLRKVAAGLVPGDLIDLYAGVRPASRTHGVTLNVEGLRVLSLTERVRLLNPVCSRCGTRMKSAGAGKGFKCPKCGLRERSAVKVAQRVSPHIRPGLYLPPPRSQRHLTRPLSRRGVRNKMSVSARPTVRWHSILAAKE